MSPYSPDRRTALVFTGTGSHGAYHAGVLRALREAGVKIDVFAGHGIGAGVAALAAIDGGARLWDDGGVWQSPRTAKMYGWRRPVVVVAWIGLALVGTLLVPLAALAIGVLGFVIGFVLGMAGTGVGAFVTGASSTWLQTAFSEPYLGTVVPRLATLALVAFVVVIALSSALDRESARRAAGGFWWRVVGAPMDARAAFEPLVAAIWESIRGAEPAERASHELVSRRYAEVLGENLGQPGFGELVVAACDLDARGDVVGAFLVEPCGQRFFAPRPGRERRAEVVDLTGEGCDGVMDLVAAAMTPPVGCIPHLVTYAAAGFWRGETHRACDRPGLLNRLIEEVGAAGATQAIVVSAVAPASSPHDLRSPRLDPRGRLSEFHTAAEAASLRDALSAARARFDLVSVICPAHNAVGPFDSMGSFDEASDQHQDLSGLIALGYEDAHTQFIDPVVGASGEALRDATGGAGMASAERAASWGE